MIFFFSFIVLFSLKRLFTTIFLDNIVFVCHVCVWIFVILTRWFLSMCFFFSLKALQKSSIRSKKFIVESTKKRKKEINIGILFTFASIEFFYCLWAISIQWIEDLWVSCCVIVIFFTLFALWVSKNRIILSNKKN